MRREACVQIAEHRAMPRLERCAPLLRLTRHPLRLLLQPERDPADCSESRQRQRSDRDEDGVTHGALYCTPRLR